MSCSCPVCNNARNVAVVWPSLRILGASGACFILPRTIAAVTQVLLSAARQVDASLTNFIVANGLPFDLVTSPYFRRLLSDVGAFGRGYVPPARSTVSTVLLSGAKRKVEEDLLPLRRSYGKYGYSITSDGWSDTRNWYAAARRRPWVATIAATPYAIHVCMYWSYLSAAICEPTNAQRMATCH